MITKEQAKTINAWLKKTTSGTAGGNQRANSRETKEAMAIIVRSCRKLSRIPEFAQWPAPPLESWLAFDDSVRTFLLYVAFTAIAREVNSLEND